MEWLSGLFALLGVLLGLGVSEYRRRQERADRYRDMTFEKRLQTHQEAYRLTMTAGDIMNQPNVQEFAGELLKLTDEAREWLNNNCLYIDRRSYLAFTSAFLSVSTYGRDLVEQRQTVNQALEYARSETEKCLKCIAEGIGAEYLPKTDKRL